MAVIGLKFLAVAPLATEVDGSVPTYSAGMRVGHLMKANLTWNRGNAKLHGDDVVVESDNTITDGTLTIGTTYLSLEGRQMMLGEEAFGTAASGSPQEYATSDDPSPYVGVGYVVKDSADGGEKIYRGWWYFKAQFGMNESAETRGDAINYQAPELEGTILAVRPDNTGKNRFGIYADFTTEAAAIAWVKGKAGIQ